METPTAKTRVCLDCGVDISHRGQAAKRCESCSKERMARDNLESNKVWKKANIEKMKVTDARYRKANPEQMKTRNDFYRKTISDGYIAGMLRLPVAQCPPKLIEMKREQLSLRRLAKVLKQEIVNQLEK